MRFMTDGVIMLTSILIAAHTALAFTDVGRALGLDPDMGVGELIMPTFHTTQTILNVALS